MFSHIMVGSNDLEKSKVFYDSIMQNLGYPAAVRDERGRYIYVGANRIFGITRPVNGEPATYGNGITIGFDVPSPELVDAFYEIGLKNGGIACKDSPKRSTSGHMNLYLAHIRDPAGNKLCAAHKFSP